MAPTRCVRHAQPRGRPRNSRRWQLLYLVQLRRRWHKLLLIDRNSLVIIYVVNLRFAFHTSSFPRFSLSHFPPPAKRYRVFQSCIFHLCSVMPRFSFSYFPLSHFQRPHVDKWMRRWIETRLVRLMEWIWKMIPKMGWWISKWAICDFEGRKVWRVRKSDNRWGRWGAGSGTGGPGGGWREIRLWR